MCGSTTSELLPKSDSSYFGKEAVDLVGLDLFVEILLDFH